MTYHVDFSSPDFDPALYLDAYDDSPSALQIEADAFEVEQARETEYWNSQAAWQEAEADAMMAYYDDDPNPYHGDFTEDDGY